MKTALLCQENHPTMAAARGAARKATAAARKATAAKALVRKLTPTSKRKGNNNNKTVGKSKACINI